MRYFSGLLLKRYRESRGIKRVWIAEQMGVSSSMLYYVEKEQKHLRLENYIKLCDALNVPLDYFISSTISSSPSRSIQEKEDL